jgi:Holliday junction resolvase RusA-like endonuclease
MTTIKFIIPGNAIGKPRMTRSDKWKRRPCVLRYRAWADMVRREVRKQVGSLPPAERVLSLNWVATFVPPKSWNKAKKDAAIGTIHRQKPDRDNIDKALLDVLYEEDKAIGAGRIVKRWGNEAKLEIEIEFEPLPEAVSLRQRAA